MTGDSRLTVYVVRHGERVDHVDETWVRTADAPYDPPLTANGWTQARQAGTLMHTLEASKPPAQEYLMLVSPFLRCAQTAEGLCAGFQAQNSLSATWKVAVEPGISEIMSENYFNSSDQVPTTIISDRQHEIQRGLVCANMAYNGGYDMASEDLPEYPESYQQMLARFAATLDRVAAGLLGKSECGRRVVVVLVTHGAGISAMQWAMARRLGANDVAYCAMLSGTATARTASPEPALTWTMEYPPPPNNRAGHQRPSL